MMKIAHLIDSAGLYGAEQVLLTLCKEQQRQGLIPLIVSCGLPKEKEKAIESAARAQSIELISWRMSAGINLGAMKELLLLLEKQGVRLVHSHGYKFNILLGLLARRAVGVPIVSTVHGYVKAKFPKKMWIYELLDRLLLQRFDAIVLVSQKMREIKAFKSSTKVHVIKNGIASECNSLPSALDAAPFKLLAIGRLSPEKGFEYLIRALAEINQVTPVFELTIFGNGGLRNYLENLVADLGLGKQVVFSGFVEDAQQYFHQYQMIVMPSLTEGIPVTLLEAMRNKTPIIASAVGGIPDVLGTNSSSLLTPASVQDIVIKLKAWLTASSAYKQQVIEQNYARFQQEFTATSMANQYLELYNLLVQKRVCQ
jgi:glycosyltransferase involved in cell wall biosynthesis